MLAVVDADNRMHSDKASLSSSLVTLVLTQEYVGVFDIDSDMQLQLMAVADIDCQLTHSSSTTQLVFSHHVVGAVIVSCCFLNFVPQFVSSLLYCYSLGDWKGIYPP